MSAAPRVFSRLAAAAMVVVGLASFAALVALAAFAPDMQGKDDPGAHALSPSAIGYAGIVQLLRDAGRPVTISRAATPREGSARAIMIVTPSREDAKEDFLALDTTRWFEGSVLQITPKWVPLSDLRRPGWVRKSPPPPVNIEALFGPGRGREERDGWTITRYAGVRTHTLYRVDGAERSPLTVTAPIDRFQTLAVKNRWAPVIVDEHGGIVLAKMTEDEVFVLSDPDLINTHGIRSLAGARAAVAILDTLPQANDGPVYFDVTLQGFGRSPSLLKTAFEPPFLAATLCIFAAILLMAWHGFFRFGPERRAAREFALGKRALADNQAALIRMTGREHRMGEGYGQIVRDLVARAIGAPRDLGPDQLDAFLDRLGASGRTSEKITALRDEARRTRDAHGLLEAARRLHQWRLEMTRERN